MSLVFLCIHATENITVCCHDKFMKILRLVVKILHILFGCNSLRQLRFFESTVEESKVGDERCEVNMYFMFTCQKLAKNWRCTTPPLARKRKDDSRIFTWIKPRQNNITNCTIGGFNFILFLEFQ